MSKILTDSSIVNPLINPMFKYLLPSIVIKYTYFTRTDFLKKGRIHIKKRSFSPAFTKLQGNRIKKEDHEGEVRRKSFDSLKKKRRTILSFKMLRTN